MLFPVEFLRRCKGAADIEIGQSQRRTGIAENQPDEVIDNEDEAERQTEIKQSGDEHERYFHGSHDHLESVAAGGKRRGEEHFDTIVHGRLPRFAINSFVWSCSRFAGEASNFFESFKTCSVIRPLFPPARQARLQALLKPN